MWCSPSLVLVASGPPHCSRSNLGVRDMQKRYDEKSRPPFVGLSAFARMECGHYIGEFRVGSHEPRELRQKISNKAEDSIGLRFGIDRSGMHGGIAPRASHAV